MWFLEYSWVSGLIAAISIEAVFLSLFLPLTAWSMIERWYARKQETWERLPKSFEVRIHLNRNLTTKFNEICFQIVSSKYVL